MAAPAQQTAHMGCIRRVSSHICHFRICFGGSNHDHAEYQASDVVEEKFHKENANLNRHDKILFSQPNCNNFSSKFQFFRLLPKLKKIVLGICCCRMTFRILAHMC